MAGAQEQVNVILDTYQGQLSITTAKQENAAIGVGELTTGVSLLGAEFMASLGPVGLFAEALGPSMLTGVMQGLTTAAIGPLIGKLIGKGGLTAALGGVSNVIPGIANMIGAAGPLGIAILGIGAAIGVFALAWKNNWFGIRDVTKTAVSAIKDTIGGIAKAAANAIKKLKELFKWKKKKKGGGGEEGGEAAGGGAGEGGTTGGGGIPTGGGGGGGGRIMDLQSGFDGILRRDMTFRAHAGEDVSVTPPGRARGGGRPIVINFNVTGSIDRRTAEYAADLMERKLRTVIFEPTSSGAATKRIRFGSIFGGVP